MSTKIFSLVLFALCGVGIYYGWQIVPEFSYEPLGPRPFPVGTLMIIAVLCVLLFFFGHAIEIEWGDAAFYKKFVIFIGSFFVFALGFEEFGFIPMSMFLALVGAMIFGARLKYAIIFSPLLALSLYVVFDLLLEVTLPRGLIFS